MESKKTFKTFVVWALCCLLLAACQNKSELQIAQASLKIGDYTRARRVFNQILNAEPTHVEARYGLALSWYKEALSLDYTDTTAQEKWQNAHREFTILAQIDSTIDISGWHSMGLFYLAKYQLAKSPQRSLELLNESIKLDPENIFSLNLKALISKELADEETAIELWTQITIIDPHYRQAWVELGKCYWDRGEFDEAYIHWQLGHEANPQDEVLKYWFSFAKDALG